MPRERGRDDAHDPYRVPGPYGAEVDKPKRTHRTDWMALLSGLLFVVLGIAFVSGDLDDPFVAIPLLLAGLGLAGFVAVIARVIRGGR
ncbi:Na+/H+ antiporter NhaD/arsenite permease-like protein [Thermocatellispora tengchongensis]|uniref:Na+/H+ antiporter NhaD/arsenite permease-like protein n=1 Tax=Thermocatellispora tengchongensis TaxID=1073253 RepID=A0A840PQG0_9ACTN|nr:hypothetical protein [Thermocatellispora tengchongensis]MBB5139317.1 Na+/H+ antiporter NhaD/arsenite permease-like protein [Thermocatellispora tengchongensis]